MSNEERTNESLQNNLDALLDYASGKDKTKVEVRTFSKDDIASIRKRMKMTQKAFAETFQFELSTLRKWEQGRRSPTGPAMVLLKVIKHDPDAVLDVLAQSA